MKSERWKRVRRSHDRSIFVYRSMALDDDLEITVVPPATELETPAAVLFVLDPLLTLDVVVGWSRVYSRYSNGVVPPVTVVGIGHPTSDEALFMALRIRDLTPTPVTGRRWTPPLGAGRGPRFLSAIADEVIPFIERNFAVTADRTIIGWSLGGLFALSALFQQPRIFSRYLVVGPSLWWGDRLPLTWERDWAKTHCDLAARLFMAVGAREEAPGGGWLSEDFSDELIAWFRQVTNFRTFVRRLKSRAYPGLQLDSVVFADEYHMTVYPAAVARGLVKLFAPVKDKGTAGA
jgi:predicted alpha/beta superfamily hydrolase